MYGVDVDEPFRQRAAAAAIEEATAEVYRGKYGEDFDRRALRETPGEGFSVLDRHPDFGTVNVRLDGVQALQDLFDAGRISIPGVKLEDTCRVRRTVPWKGMDVEVPCPHRAVLREIVQDECSACNSKKKRTIVFLCLLHAIEHHGQGAPIKDMGPLFGSHQHEDNEDE